MAGSHSSGGSSAATELPRRYRPALVLRSTMHAPLTCRFCGAQVVGLLAGVSPHAHLIERTRTTRAQRRPQDTRIATSQHGTIACRKPPVSSQRAVAGESASWTPHGLAATSLTRCSKAATKLLGACRRSGDRGFAIWRCWPFPHWFPSRLSPTPLYRNPGDRHDVIAGLGRQRARACHPVVNPLRPRIVGGGRKPEIAELAAQLAQELRRLLQRLHRIERVEQAPFGGRRRHELGDALRTLAAAGERPDAVGPELALLPDHPRKEFDRKAMSPAAESRSAGRRSSAEFGVLALSGSRHWRRGLLIGRRDLRRSLADGRREPSAQCEHTQTKHDDASSEHHGHNAPADRSLRVDARDPQKILGLKACASHQCSVDVFNREKLGGIRGLDRAAIEDANTLSHLAVQELQSRKRIKQCTSRTSAGVGVSPVPIAQTGS